MYALSLTQLLDQGNGLVGGKGELGKGGGGELGKGGSRKIYIFLHFFLTLTSTCRVPDSVEFKYFFGCIRIPSSF